MIRRCTAARTRRLHRRSFLPRMAACSRIAASACSAATCLLACLRAHPSSAVSPFGCIRSRLGPRPSAAAMASACMRSDSIMEWRSRDLATNSCRT